MSAPREQHRLLIAQLPPEETFLGRKWVVTCTHNHFVRFSSTWAGAWRWANEHCPALAARLSGSKGDDRG